MEKNRRKAFPSMFGSEDKGISMRDYFAAQALTGIIAKYGVYDEEMACVAYSMADEMMEQREK